MMSLAALMQQVAATLINIQWQPTQESTETEREVAKTIPAFAQAAAREAEYRIAVQGTGCNSNLSSIAHVLEHESEKNI